MFVGIFFIYKHHHILSLLFKNVSKMRHHVSVKMMSLVLGSLILTHSICLGSALESPTVSVQGDYQAYLLSWTPVSEATEYALCYSDHPFNDHSESTVRFITNKTFLRVNCTHFPINLVYIEIIALKETTESVCDLGITVENTTVYFAVSPYTENWMLNFSINGTAQRYSPPPPPPPYYYSGSPPSEPADPYASSNPPSHTLDRRLLLRTIGIIVGCAIGGFMLIIGLWYYYSVRRKHPMISLKEKARVEKYYYHSPAAWLPYDEFLYDLCMVQSNAQGFKQFKDALGLPLGMSFSEACGFIARSYGSQTKVQYCYLRYPTGESDSRIIKEKWTYGIKIHRLAGSEDQGIAIAPA